MFGYRLLRKTLPTLASFRYAISTALPPTLVILLPTLSHYFMSYVTHSLGSFSSSVECIIRSHRCTPYA